MASAKKNLPLISVILPVYNGQKFISEAIESIFSQNYKPLELIIVDDGSTDKTEEILNTFEKKITYIKQDTHGPSHARNKGVMAANGKYITFIDADDVWAAESLSFHRKQFKKFKDLDISIGLTNKLKFQSVKDIDSLKQNISLHLVLGACMIKKTAFKDVGLFDEELILRQDTDWFLRAKEVEKRIAIGEKVVLFYRKHSDNRTNNKRKYMFYLFKLLKKAKDRRSSSEYSFEHMLKKPDNQEELIEIWHNAGSKNYN